jgi:hypothetical protein
MKLLCKKRFIFLFFVYLFANLQVLLDASQISVIEGPCKISIQEGIPTFIQWFPSEEYFLCDFGVYKFDGYNCSRVHAVSVPHKKDCTSFDSSGKYLVTYDEQAQAIRIYLLNEAVLSSNPANSIVEVYSGQMPGVQSIAWHSNGSYLITSNKDETNVKLTAFSFDGKKLEQKSFVNLDSDGRAPLLKFSPKYPTRLLVAGIQSEEIRIFYFVNNKFEKKAFYKLGLYEWRERNNVVITDIDWKEDIGVFSVASHEYQNSNETDVLRHFYHSGSSIKLVGSTSEDSIKWINEEIYFCSVYQNEFSNYFPSFKSTYMDNYKFQYKQLLMDRNLDTSSQTKFSLAALSYLKHYFFVGNESKLFLYRICYYDHSGQTEAKVDWNALGNSIGVSVDENNLDSFTNYLLQRKHDVELLKRQKFELEEKIKKISEENLNIETSIV